MLYAVYSSSTFIEKILLYGKVCYNDFNLNAYTIMALLILYYIINKISSRFQFGLNMYWNLEMDWI